MITYVVQITTKIEDYRYNLYVKCQGQICLISVLRFVAQTTLSFLMKGFYVWHIDCLWLVHDKNGSDHHYGLGL